MSMLGHEAFYDMIRTITVADWINGVTRGEDLLKAGDMAFHLKSRHQEPARYEKSIKIFARGHANASNLEGNRNGLAIFENRGLNPLGGKSLNIDQAVELARAYMAFMVQVRRAQGDERRVGAFPRVGSM
jgi:hypothetical protein